MKKKSPVILSIVIMVISITLLINKSSYAAEPINYCVDFINEVKITGESIDLIEGVSLTTGIEGIVGHPDDQPQSVGTLFFSNEDTYSDYIWDYENNNKVWQVAGVGYDGYDSSEIGYLLTQLEFSEDEIENNYYQQVLIFWALDRLAGYEDEYNYILDDNLGTVVTTGDENGIENNIPAAIKSYIKSQPVGTKMLNYLEEWENYVNWNLQENKTMELDQINAEDITYTVTENYLETNLIIPTNKNKPYEKLFNNYQVEVPEPFVVVNSEGEEQTTFNAKEGFKVRIPISKIQNNKLDYTINIKGIYSIPTTRIYNGWTPRRIENSEQKDILLSKLSNALILKNCITENNEETTMTINYTQQVGNLNIKVIDAETKENLANAEIAIYDSLGNIVYRISTTNSEINVTLPIGDYTVKQTVTPENYQPVVVQKRVSVTGNETTEAVLENIQLIEVPDLGQRVKGILTMIGGIAVIIGGLIIGLNLRKNKKKQN